MTLSELYLRIESFIRSLTSAGDVTVTTQTVDHSTLASSVRSYFGDRSVRYVFTDGSYTATDEAGIERLRASSPVSDDLYRPEVYDCEDFARAFRHFCVGPDYGVSAVGTVYDWTNAHAYNVVCLTTDDGLTVSLYEPQDGTILEIGETHAVDGGTEVTYDPQNAAVII